MIVRERNKTLMRKLFASTNEHFHEEASFHDKWNLFHKNNVGQISSKTDPQMMPIIRNWVVLYDDRYDPSFVKE